MVACKCINAFTTDEFNFHADPVHTAIASNNYCYLTGATANRLYSEFVANDYMLSPF